VNLHQKVHHACLALLGQKISLLENTLRELTEGAQNDTKSSAGDKHETARAMMQLEQEKIGRQLQDTLQQKGLLEKTGAEISSDRIVSGSLVKTDRGYLYVCIALGKVTVDDLAIMVISPQSPLGAKLLGLRAGETANINNTLYKIEHVG